MFPSLMGESAFGKLRGPIGLRFGDPPPAVTNDTVAQNAAAAFTELDTYNQSGSTTSVPGNTEPSNSNAGPSPTGTTNTVVPLTGPAPSDDDGSTQWWAPLLASAPAIIQGTTNAIISATASNAPPPAPVVAPPTLIFGIPLSYLLLGAAAYAVLSD